MSQPMITMQEIAVQLSATKRHDFKSPRVPQEYDSAELLVRRKAEYARLREHKLAIELIPLHVKIRGPIGIAHLGDPHLDDNGCNIEAIERHAQIINATPGMYAATVGDPTNNWVGKLAGKYSEQSTSEDDALVLLDWFIAQFDWFYFLDGNHGVWTNLSKLIAHMLKNKVIGKHGAMSARMNLIFPNGRQVRVNARHDFRGGPVAAIRDGWRDHIVVCGHKHHSEYQPVKDPMTGLISHAIRVASYQTYSRYAETLGLDDYAISPCVTTIIDPDAKEETGLVQVFQDVGLAADFLKYLRAKRGYKE